VDSRREDREERTIYSKESRQLTFIHEALLNFDVEMESAHEFLGVQMTFDFEVLSKEVLDDFHAQYRPSWLHHVRHQILPDFFSCRETIVSLGLSFDQVFLRDKRIEDELWTAAEVV